MPDDVEAEYGTDASKADTDGDGFSDIEEILRGSSPVSAASVPEKTLADSDGDGIEDLIEVSFRSDLNADERIDQKDVVILRDKITKAQTLSAADVVRYDLNGDTIVSELDMTWLVQTISAMSSNPLAKIMNLDPYKADTDGDGYSDWEEIERKTNPSDSASHPVSYKADLDLNGIVDASDLQILDRVSRMIAGGDINGDNLRDIKDIELVKKAAGAQNIEMRAIDRQDEGIFRE